VLPEQCVAGKLLVVLLADYHPTDSNEASDDYQEEQQGYFNRADSRHGIAPDSYFRMILLPPDILPNGKAAGGGALFVWAAGVGQTFVSLATFGALYNVVRRPELPCGACRCINEPNHHR
jgi:hypothetical protein